jgi:chromosome segregation ATPase
MTSPYWTVMNDLSNTITSYLTVRDLIRDNTEDPKVLDMAVELLEYFINKQDKAFDKAWEKVVGKPGTIDDIEPLNIQDLKHDALYQNDPAYTENNKGQIYKNYRAAIDEYNTLKQEYDSLQLDYEHLQDLFYRVDSELDELKVKYDQVQSNYHKVVSELKQSLNRD